MHDALEPNVKILIFGDDDFLRLHTASHRFISLLQTGLVGNGAQVSLSCDQYVDGISIGKRAWRSLRRVPKVRDCHVVLYYGQAVTTLIALAVWCRLRRIFFISYLVEWPPSVPGRSKASEINAQLFGRLVFRLPHGATVISQELATKAHSIRPELPVRVLPIMSEAAANPPTGEIERVEDAVNRSYVVLCADLDGYRPDATFAINVIAKVAGHVNLVLVGAASAETSAVLASAAESSGASSRVDIRSQLSQLELTMLYRGAVALLMPIRDDERSRCRFPSKLADYLSAGRPVITSRVGEVGRLFEEGAGVIFAAEMDALDWADKLELLLADPDRANRIGLIGLERSNEIFDCTKVTADLLDFLRAVLAPPVQPAKI